MKFPRKIYVIEHNQTKRIYVGSTFDMKSRIAQHMNSLKNHKHPVPEMQKDFDEFGNDFSIKVVDEILNFQDKQKEYDWMEKLHSITEGKGYNLHDPKFKYERMEH